MRELCAHLECSLVRKMPWHRNKGKFNCVTKGQFPNFHHHKR